MQKYISRVLVDFADHTATITFIGGYVPDATQLIMFVEAIDMANQRIDTYVDGNPDTSFEYRDSKWVVIRPEVQ